MKPFHFLNFFFFFYLLWFSPAAYLVTQRLLPEEPRRRRLMTSDQDTKVVAEPQVQQVQEAKENSHSVSVALNSSSWRKMSPGLFMSWVEVFCPPGCVVDT